MALSLLIGAFLAIQGASFVVSGCVSSDLLASTWDLVDEGEVIPFSLLLKKEIVKESGVYGLAATVTAVGELAWPRPASGCGHSKLINANVALHNGNLERGELDEAINSYAVVLAQAVDNLRILGLCCIVPAPWPTLENSCGDYGRIYEFEESWNLAKGVGKGVSCAARRLYTAFGARANNVGAAVTSATTVPALSIVDKIKNELATFLKIVVDKSPCNCKSKQKKMRSLAGSLKAAIFKAAGETKNELHSRCRH